MASCNYCIESAETLEPITAASLNADIKAGAFQAVHRKTTLRGVITLSILILCQGSINNVAFTGGQRIVLLP
jgi:hypothetical protein